jgi:hypothetical protein
MKFWSDSFKDGAVIPGAFAFCIIDPATHVRISENRNPQFSWRELPAGTKSIAIVCHDPDVPSKGDDVNQEGKTVPADLPRVDFYHWAMVDMPGVEGNIDEGAVSDGITACGKPGPGVLGADTLRHGLNDYTGWFAGDPELKGEYFGYDGPCPPWNDSILHHYIFTLYALDVERLPVEGKFTCKEAVDAMRGHILGQARHTGIYSLNPELAAAI